MLNHEQMLEQLKRSVSAHRFEHTMGVVTAAERLAAIHGADIGKAKLAALLHDCAKGMTAEEMLSAVKEQGISLYPGESDFEPLMHAPAGAAVARTVYGVEDPEVLSAIRKHTTGVSMNLLEAIIYVADFIEPGRRDFEGLSEVRRLADEDVFKAARECARLTEEYCKARGQKVFVPA